MKEKIEKMLDLMELAEEFKRTKCELKLAVNKRLIDISDVIIFADEELRRRILQDEKNQG